MREGSQHGGAFSRARISDVAAAAGVSTTTVSHALSGARTVNADTRARILAAAEALGYAPDRVASGLRRKRTGIVGFIGDDVATTPFAGPMIAGARRAGLEQDVLMLVAETEGDAEHEQSLIDRLLAQRVDGLLFARMFHRRVAQPVRPFNVPIVLVNAAPEEGWSVDSVVPDEAQIATLACDPLLRAGHRRFAYVGTVDDTPAARGRLIAIRSGLGNAGVHLGDHRITHVASDAAGGRVAGAQLLDSTDIPTAIICFNDQIAMGVIQAAARRGLRVPDDLSVVRIDDLRLVADALDPGLTTVALPHAQMGEWAMSRLLSRIAGPETEIPGRLHLMPGWLVERGSVAPPPPHG
ncbi:LacI family DNA-binding transcriptional regulator [Micromonospora sp. DT81.3]|uniref:LacI family DNA-binding transcriptional regulator n=1 Tax=Micromonospora sp. DT81.3 TaxID=3416523 RepID=UPI003CEADEAE